MLNLTKLAKKDVATIQQSAKAWDILQEVMALENYSEALAVSYLECLVEQLEAKGFTKDEYKSKISKRKKVLLFAAGALKGMDAWSDDAVSTEVNTMLCQPSIEKAYKFATESLKDAKQEGDSDGEGEGGEECTEPTGAALSEAKQALVRLAFDLIAAMPEQYTDDAHDALKELFERYEA